MWASSTGGSDGLVPQRRWRKAGRMEMRRSVGEVTRVVVGLLLPGRCASCGQPADVLCRPCRHDFSRARLPFPSRATPTPCPPGLPTTITAAPLVEPLRGLVTAYKDQGRRDLVDLLADVLAGALRVAVHATASPVVVPVPGSSRGRRHRGDRPVEDLVVAATARLADPPPVWRAVVFARSPADQAGLDREARAANLRESMVPSPGLGRRLEGRQVVIVDDVMTTGATLVEAARVLRECGAHPRAAVLAATQRQPVVRDREPD